MTYSNDPTNVTEAVTAAKYRGDNTAWDMAQRINFDLIARRAQPHVRNQACRPGHDPWTCARCGARGEHAHLHGAEIGWGRFACESCYGVVR